MTESRRERVEHGLVAALQVRGREPQRHSMVDRMERYCVPGVAVAVVEDCEVAWASGHGVCGPGGAPVGGDTLFQAASISKAVAAVGVLALVEHGTLDLDADVNGALRRWQLPASACTAERPVTLRHLLSHTAGTTVPGFPGYPLGSLVPDVVGVLSGVDGANTPAVESFAVPGSVGQYSGGGSTVVQLLVEDATGRSFAESMHDLVLRPLGMTDSAYLQPLPPERRVRAALAHDTAGRPVGGGFHVYPELQAAGLWSTATDLARWVAGVQRILGGERGGAISPETARLMVTPVGVGPFGLGPELAGEGALRRFGHGAANQGYKGQVDGMVDGSSGAVVLTNGEGGTTLVGEVRRALAAEYGWGDLGPAPIDVVELPERELRRLVGRYSGPFDRPLRIELADGELFSPAPYGRRRMLPIGPTTFIDEETGVTLQAEIDGERVARIAVLVDGSELMAFEPMSPESQELP
ncbi:MAG: beta-lactamase family protein [Acidobacteria bacterium]|nr:beta-lactamase family protein [Acidobacteriota bacterium]